MSSGHRLYHPQSQRFMWQAPRFTFRGSISILNFLSTYSKLQILLVLLKMRRESDMTVRILSVHINISYIIFHKNCSEFHKSSISRFQIWILNISTTKGIVSAIRIESYWNANHAAPCERFTHKYRTFLHIYNSKV